MGSSALTPRVVFDTNTVVSALLFSKGRMAWLRGAWREGQVIPLVSKATAEEILRVLAYPKFALSKAEQEELLGDYLPFMETVAVGDAIDDLPECRDPDDQKFLVLAVAGEADVLVTGDDDILALKADFPIPILTPAEFRHRKVVNY